MKKSNQENVISDFNLKGGGDMSLNQVPAADRFHIAVFGKRNVGKSSFINALTNQDISIVSDVAGTTADPVYKNIEIFGVGACVLIDTAGFDDVGTLGEMRVEKTRRVLDKCDLAILIFSGDDYSSEMEWVKLLDKKEVPYIPLIGKYDIKGKTTSAEIIKEITGISPTPISSVTYEGIDEVKKLISRHFKEKADVDRIIPEWIKSDDVVVLVMPQDSQAPKGRLILPQVQTIRSLLDEKCITVCVTTDKLEAALSTLKNPPKLIITDSQVFGEVYALKPADSKITSFSVLFAKHKGDINEFVKGAAQIDKLTENDRVLIAESCSHNPQDGDIGREKIPAMLRKKAGQGLIIDIVGGADFPEDLSLYSLIIHCGGCMFNRKHVLSRVNRAKEQNIPITNYGIAIAKMKGILDKVEW